MKYLGGKILLLQLFGIKNIQEVMMQDGYLIIMILFYVTQKIKGNGREIYYQERQKVKAAIQMLTMTQEVFGHQVRAMLKHQVIKLILK